MSDPITPTVVSAPTSPSAAIVVGGGSQYTTIQQGLLAAEQAGIHSVIVNPGVYTETDTLTSADNGLTITSVSSGVTLKGSININGASDITISGLTFQGNGSNVAVDALNSQRVTVTDNTFTGTSEAVVLDGTGSSLVSNNLITNTTSSAIEAKNGANNDTIDCNVISGVSAPGTIGAIFLHGSNNSTITHNQITNTAGAGISLMDYGAPGTTDTQNNNSTIAYNSLDHVDTQSQDSGAIYILGRSMNAFSNDVVTMNFIGSIGSFGAHAVGIYLDDNASGVSVTRNIVEATPTMSDVFQIHGGSNDTFSGNIFDLGTGATTAGLLQQDEADQQPQGGFSQLQNDVVTGNVYTTESFAPRNPGFSDLTGGIGNPSVVRNDFWAYSGVALNVAGNGGQGDGAPGFTAPATQSAQSLSDYSTWSSAGIGFQAIDTTQIGTHPIGAHAY